MWVWDLMHNSETSDPFCKALQRGVAVPWCCPHGVTHTQNWGDSATLSSLIQQGLQMCSHLSVINVLVCFKAEHQVGKNDQ